VRHEITQYRDGGIRLHKLQELACISRWSFAMVGRQGGLKRSAGKVIVDKYYR